MVAQLRSAYITIQACENPEAVFVWTDEPQTEACLAGGRDLVSGEAYIDSGAANDGAAAKSAVSPRRLGWANLRMS